MKRKIICTVAAALLATSTASFGAVKEGSFAVTPLIGGYMYDGNKTLDPTFVLGLRAGFNFTKNFGIEALYDYAAQTDEKDGPLTDISMQRLGGQALYHFFPDNIFVPYLAAGYSSLEFDGDGSSHRSHRAFDYGVGAKYFMTEDIAVRGDIRHIIYRFDSATYNDMEFTLGAYFQFGGAAPAAKPVVAAPAPAAEPVKEVVAAPAPAPAPAAAPAPAPVPVPVPPADSDRDGIIDPLDKCPGTPDGVVVDAVGCPVDSDKDMVADYLDKCPNTPAGVMVDASGCPVDTDNDGVADYLDKCPSTPAGAAVDSKGCPEMAAKRFCDKPAVIAITFDANKSDIKAVYHDELDKLGNFLKEFPNSKGTIEGHTDADGSKSANMKLSQARAENIRSYIISKFGIDGSRLTAKGYGPAKPVASNKTRDGKAKNRRIEASFICE